MIRQIKVHMSGAGYVNLAPLPTAPTISVIDISNLDSKAVKMTIFTLVLETDDFMPYGGKVWFSSISLEEPCFHSQAIIEYT